MDGSSNWLLLLHDSVSIHTASEVTEAAKYGIELLFHEPDSLELHGLTFIRIPSLKSHLCGHDFHCDDEIMLNAMLSPVLFSVEAANFLKYLHTSGF